MNNINDLTRNIIQLLPEEGYAVTTSMGTLFRNYDGDTVLSVVHDGKWVLDGYLCDEYTPNFDTQEDALVHILSELEIDAGV